MLKVEVIKFKCLQMTKRKFMDLVQSAVKKYLCI